MTKKGGYQKFSVIGSKYEVVRLVTETQHSKVYLVKHTQLSVYRIAKLVTKSKADYERILREANIIKNLKHTGIPLVYDVEEDSDSICIIEEYISGNSLAEYIAISTISLWQILEISIKLCEVLAYLHEEAGIMHLDLKPSNIIVRKADINEYDICIIDFDSSVFVPKEGGQSNMLPEGFAGDRDEISASQDVNASHEISASQKEKQKQEAEDGCGNKMHNSIPFYGTIGFAAPEQYAFAAYGGQPPTTLRDNPKDLLCGSDIYSMGMLLLYMLSRLHVQSTAESTARSLFCGARMTGGADKEFKPMEAEELCRLYSDTVGPVIQKCIRHNRCQRYESIQELRNDLETVLSQKAKKQIVNTEKACNIYVRGTQHGVGTTHFCLCMASFLQRHFAKEKVLYMRHKDVQDVRPEACKGRLEKGGAYVLHGLHIMPDYRGTIACDLSSYTVIVHDCGVKEGTLEALQGAQTEADPEADPKDSGGRTIEILLAQGGYRKDALLFLTKRSRREIVFINHISGKAFYELVKRYEAACREHIPVGTRFFRMPCMYEWHKHNKLFEEAVIEAFKERQILRFF